MDQSQSTQQEELKSKPKLCRECKWYDSWRFYDCKGSPTGQGEKARLNATGECKYYVSSFFTKFKRAFKR